MTSEIEKATSGEKSSELARPELIVSDKSDFTTWYKSVLEYTKFLDDRYPLKGAYVWRPFGFKALRLMLGIIDEVLSSHGHEEVCFPLLCPASLFNKEADFLKGMKTESLRVTKYGDNTLGEELIVRPTSETIMYPIFSLWIRSRTDLPLKVYQTVPVFRWETKMTSPMLRLREVSKFNESHTVHESQEDMEKQMKDATDAYCEIFDRLLLPYVIVKSPSWETFPGAIYNLDFVSVLPNGKAVELASIIALGQKFSKVYDIKFADVSGGLHYAWQTCYGLSERALGTAIAIHSDRWGLRLPSEVSPIQVVIVPIKREKDSNEVGSYCKEIEILIKKHYRTTLDERDVTPGRKFYDWEAHGVPVRLEVGPRECGAHTVTLVPRHSRTKNVVNLSDLLERIGAELSANDQNLRESGLAFFRTKLRYADTVNDAKSILDHDGGAVGLRIPDMSVEGQKVAEDIGGTALGTIYEDATHNASILPSDAKGASWLFFAKTV